ncbi:Mob1/phocein [Lyophyllum atratum]|nr:Mob1/phocein [Lyophyllum atratum]
MSFFNSIGRSMTRAQRPKRSPTPTSTTFPPIEMPPPKPSPPSPTLTAPKPLYLCPPFVDSVLVKGNFKTIVMLPKYVDIMEWVAVNSELLTRLVVECFIENAPLFCLLVYDFYTNLNEFYGVIAECCTQQHCPKMSAGPALNYTWINQDRKSVHLPAPTYIDYVMTWVQNLLDDDNTFPTKAGQEFSPSFPSTVKHVYRQLLRVFAHIYHAHYHQLLHLRSEPHFNSLFAHFLAFGREYQLLEMIDVKGSPSAPVGVGQLWDAWKQLGILEGQ